MVAEIIKNYTKENPYRLRWRWDFDPTLESVLTINGDDPQTEEERNELKDQYGYLKNVAAFVKAMKLPINLRDGSRYIDYVNEGWPNPDGLTYSFRQYWRTSKGTEVFDYEGNNAPFSKEGLFQFDDSTYPTLTRVVEDGYGIYDYRINTYTEDKL